MNRINCSVCECVHDSYLLGYGSQPPGYDCMNACAGENQITQTRKKSVRQIKNKDVYAIVRVKTKAFPMTSTTVSDSFNSFDRVDFIFDNLERCSYKRVNAAAASAMQKKSGNYSNTSNRSVHTTTLTETTELGLISLCVCARVYDPGNIRP